jgi:hypothetical protein
MLRATIVAAGLALALLAGCGAGDGSGDNGVEAAEAAKAVAEARRAELAEAEKRLDGLKWEARSINTLPSRADGSCMDVPAKLYDACAPQTGILDEAITRAAESGKAVVVVYGAEWCVWCHIFYHHVDGNFGTFNYNLEGDKLDMAESLLDVSREDVLALNHFAADNLVLAYLSADGPDGADVLDQTGVADSFRNELPFIFSVDSRGRGARILDHGAVAFTIDGGLFGPEYSGYDRKRLLGELDAMARLARTSVAASMTAPVTAAIAAP